VGQIIKDGQALADDFMAGGIFDIGNEADAAGIVLMARVVQPLPFW